MWENSGNLENSTIDIDGKTFTVGKAIVKGRIPRLIQEEIDRSYDSIPFYLKFFYSKEMFEKRFMNRLARRLKIE